MNILTITYLAIMALGVAWVIYRIISYLRAERERDTVTHLMFSEEQFKAYLADAGNQTGGAKDSVPPKPPESSSLTDEERRE
jgi:hypothetical protein